MTFAFSKPLHTSTLIFLLGWIRRGYRLVNSFKLSLGVISARVARVKSSMPLFLMPTIVIASVIQNGFKAYALTVIQKKYEPWKGPQGFCVIIRGITLVVLLIRWIIDELSSFNEFGAHIEKQLSNMAIESAMGFQKFPSQKWCTSVNAYA